MSTRYLVRHKQAPAAIAQIAMRARIGRNYRETQVRTLARVREETDLPTDPLRQWSLDVSLAQPGLMKDGRPERLARLPISNFDVYRMSPAQANQLRNDLPEFDVIEDAAISLIDPLATEEKPAINAEKDLWHLESIGLSAARSAGRVGNGNGVQVAILDTGIANHQELAGRIVPGVQAMGSSGRTVPLPGPTDSDGHGTHVAGLVAGSTVGVAPAARVVNVLCLPGGRGFLSDILLAIEWAAQQPDISIINVSAGMPGFVRGFGSAIDAALAAGVLPVFAVGNEGRSQSRSPGNYAAPLSIGAHDDADKVASFSGGGTITIDNQTYTVPDVVAPGVGVWSSIRTGGYGKWDGTSMATPIVSGMAALLVERNPAISVIDLRDAIESTARNLGFPSDRQGKGAVRLT